jgi:tetratricopeptide (TPR) repeat protein
MKIAAFVRHALFFTYLAPGTAVVAENSALMFSQNKPDTSSEFKSPKAKPSRAAKQSGHVRTNSKPPKGVAAQFSQAMVLFNAGKFNEVLIAFDTIHKTYPAHEPTTIQYAKTLYRLDRIPESYNLFARIKPQYLDPETAYEYGYSFYIQNHFDGALYSFQRVPQDHALYDLASYYGAMCAIRLKKYAVAEELLDKAVVLPDKLARNKSLYVKHVASLRQLQEKSELERATIDEKQRMADDSARAQMPKPTPGLTDSAAAQKPAATPNIYKGFYSVKHLGKLSFSSIHESSDLHGYSRRNYTNKSGAFEFRHGPMLELPFGDNNHKAAIGGELTLIATSLTSEGTQERLVAYEDSAQIIHNLSERLPKKTTNTGEARGIAWIETPLQNGFWLGTDGHLGFSYPNFERGQRFGFRGLTGSLGWKNDDPVTSSAQLSGTYDLIVDSEAQPITSQTIAMATTTIATPEGFSVVATGKYVFYDYNLPILPGPDTSTSAAIKLIQDFPLGISISLGGVAEMQANYIARNLPNFISASASGQVLTGNGKLTVAPVSWLTLSAKVSRSKTTWVVHEAERQEEFKSVTPNYTDSSELLGAINFSF